MKEKLAKSGKRLALRIPPELTERYHMAAGVEVEITPRDEGILLTPIGVPPWFSLEWERALDGVLERYKPALELVREALAADAASGEATSPGVDP